MRSCVARELDSTLGDKEVLHFFQTHQHNKGLTAQERDRICKRAGGYRWMGSSLFKLMEEE